jgi:hypothetical protein
MKPNKETMHNYIIKYSEKGEIKTEVFEGSNPGHAMSKAVEAGIKPISAIRKGGFGDGYGQTEWECPSLVKPKPLPKETAEQLTMPL